jgi:hypothetical protein
MHGFVLQDFVTIRGQSTTQTVTQSESEWLDLAGYEDLVTWIDVREVTLSGNTNVQINMQTAPIKDEYLFVNMEVNPLTVTAALTSPSIRKMVLAQATGATGTPVPLGRFVRWQAVASGATGTWDVVFRIACCANPVGDAGGRGMMMPGMPMGGRQSR